MRNVARWSVLRPAALGVAACALVVGMVGADAAIAGATTYPVTKFATYVGGHGKAKSKSSAVTIGIVNQQTSTDAIAPEWTTGAEMAAKYVNQHTGGIDGHPLKLDLCKVATTVADATSCGQEFADDNAVDAVAAGPIDVGNTALESALAPSKKPLVFGVSLSTIDSSYADGFILAGTATGIEPPMATFAKKDLHAKSVSITYPSDIPGEVTSANIIEAALKYEGVKTVYKVGFTSADTNLTEPFEAAHVGSTTLTIAVNSGGTACSDTYLTLKSLAISTKVLVNEPCDTPTIAKADGGQLPHDWYYAAASPMGGSSTPGVPAVQKVATEYGHANTGGNGLFVTAFAEVLWMAKLDTQILKSGKKITPAAVMHKARSYRGSDVWGPPHLHCGAEAGAPASCNDEVNVFQNTSSGVMKQVASWIAPPKGFKLSSTS